MPLLDAATWQRATQEGLHTEITLAFEEPAADTKPAQLTLVPGVPRRDVLNIGDETKLRQGLLSLAREAGFGGVLRQLVVDRTQHSASRRSSSTKPAPRWPKTPRHAMSRP